MSDLTTLISIDEAGCASTKEKLMSHSTCSSMFVVPSAKDLEDLQSALIKNCNRIPVVSTIKFLIDPFIPGDYFPRAESECGKIMPDATPPSILVAPSKAQTFTPDSPLRPAYDPALGKPYVLTTPVEPIYQVAIPGPFGIRRLHRWYDVQKADFDASMENLRRVVYQHAWTIPPSHTVPAPRCDAVDVPKILSLLEEARRVLEALDTRTLGLCLEIDAEVTSIREMPLAERLNNATEAARYRWKRHQDNKHRLAWALDPAAVFLEYDAKIDAAIDIDKLRRKHIEDASMRAPQYTVDMKAGA